MFLRLFRSCVVNMEIVCLDNHILVWGIKEEASSGQEEMIHRAKRFFKWLDNEGYKVLIPANVIAEFLMLIPHEGHGKVISQFNRYFIVAPFDTAAASCFAKIWRKRNDDGTIERLKENGVTKNKITGISLILTTNKKVGLKMNT